MSEFRVPVVTLDVEPHPDSDRLDVCRPRGTGWQCVSARGQFQTGDAAVYLPVDSVLPPELVEKLGIAKFYNKRLRTVKLRGRISQGMVAPVSILPASAAVGDDVAGMLGVTKYEVPIPIHMAGIVLPDDPAFCKYTDIENIKNYPSAIPPGTLVTITEKIHGTNWRAAMVNGTLLVGSHRQNLKENPDNLYWRAAAMLDLKNKLRDGEQIFGEVYGYKVQELTYGKGPGQISVAVFDFMRDGRYLNRDEFLDVLHERGWESMGAPAVFDGPMPENVAEVTQGDSRLCPGQIREGVVIKPVVEQYSEELQGRMILKSISDAYLLKTDRTEYH